MKKALFLHWGPGGHCGVERDWFGDRLPIDWWDQPAVAADSSPFRTLVEKSEKRFLELFDANRGPLDLYGHSIGGQIAARIALRHPEKVKSLQLIASSFNTPRAFLNLGKRLLKGQKSPELEAARASLTESTFWPLAGRITAIPGFLDHYWGSGSSGVRDKFNRLAATHAPLDMATFAAVMNDLLRNPPPFPSGKYTGTVELLLGREDPLTELAEETSGWKGIFPQLRVRIAECGHFAQFERPESEWFTGGSALS